MDKIRLRWASHLVAGLVWVALLAGKAVAQTATPTASPTPTDTPPAVANDLCSTATVVLSTPYTQTVSASLATMSAGDPAPSCGNHSTAKSIWYAFTPPSSGTVTAYTLGSNYDTILSAYTGTCMALVPVVNACNDDAFGTVQSRLPITVAGGTTYFFMVSATTGSAGSAHFSLTFDLAPGPTLTFTRTPTITTTPTPTRTSTQTSVITGTPTPTRTVTPTSTRTFTLVPGATNTPTFTVPSAPTNTPTQTPTTVGGVPNDACGNATNIASAPYTNNTSVSTATMDASDPLPGCGNNSELKTVWYRFTAPSAGTILANTFGSSYDTILSVFTGACGAFTAVSGGCSDDAPGSAQSQVSFAATGGTTYFFMVSSYSGNGGNLVFSLTFQGVPITGTVGATKTNTPTQTAPSGPTSTATTTRTATTTPTSPAGLPNDACGNATNIASAPYTNSVNTSMATMEAGDPLPGCGNNSQQKTVWYRFTAPGFGMLTANTFGSSYDTILSAQTGSCGAFTGVPGGCNDDAPSSSQSQVSFTATGGTTYFFMVSAYTGNGGTLVFNLTFQAINTPTPTVTATVTSTATRTFTLSPTITQTPTVTLTRTITPTLTITPTPTITPTVTLTPTVTRTATITPTGTITPTVTLTPTSTPPAVPNDVCSTSFIGSVVFNNSQATVAATTDVTDPTPSCGNHSRGKSVWYRFTAPGPGTVTASTFISNYDTILSVYTGSCGNLTETTCNDDAPFTSQSQVSFAATGGTTYFFLITAYTNNGGNLVFNLNFTP